MAAKDYFQDILSQSGPSAGKGPVKRTFNAASDDSDDNTNFSADTEDTTAGRTPVRRELGEEGPVGQAPVPSGERSIRNITVSPRRSMRPNPLGMRNSYSGINPPSSGSPAAIKEGNSKRAWVWIAAAVSLLVLLLLGLFAFRSTKVTITPSSRQVVFQENATFTAFPQTTASEGVLTYTVVSNELEDSAVVPSSGTENVSEKASGNLVVYNEYSSSPVRLLKNTRFATPDGLVFRAPASITIPGKKGNTPGSITVTVFADQPGAEYNVGPISKFTLPGLKSSADMYAKVYARSNAPFSGGFVGSRPAVPAGARESARAEIRGRIESKAREAAKTLSTDTSTVFPDLIQITYTSLPETAEAGGGVRIQEKARIDIPVFSAPQFAEAAHKMLDPEATSAGVSILATDTLTARRASSSDPALGSSAIEFTVSGNATIVWNVDSAALAAALAGREQSDFQNVVKGFAGIQEARATIQPFWKSSFPTDPDKIRILIKPVSAAQ